MEGSNESAANVLEDVDASRESGSSGGEILHCERVLDNQTYRDDKTFGGDWRGVAFAVCGVGPR